MTMTPPQGGFKHIVAVEVSKDELVVHILPGDRRMRIANTAKAIERLLRAEIKLNAKHGIGPLLVICEATGGYERHVLDASVALGLACHRAHGSRVRCFAKYLGLAKTDPIDARVLALYGLHGEGLRLYEPPSPEEAALKDLKSRRDQLQAMLIAESNRLDKACPREGGGTPQKRARSAHRAYRGIAQSPGGHRGRNRRAPAPA